MKELSLSGSTWQTTNDFYTAFFAAVGAPDWHGRNLNALSDSIGTGGINIIETPYAIKITGLNQMSSEARELVVQFRILINELQAEGVAVSMIAED